MSKSLDHIPSKPERDFSELIECFSTSNTSSNTPIYSSFKSRSESNHEAGDIYKISAWYKDRSILITGGTGFVGKILIEKLLRSCRQLKRIYLLIRHKNGLQPNERLKKLLQEPIFELIRSLDETILDKVQVIKGDLSLPNLNISELDHNELADNVSIIFHCAANTDIYESIKVSTVVNVVGTKYLLALANDMRKLKAFVYLTTIHAFSEKNVIDEKIFTTQPPPSTIAESLLSLSENLTANITKDLIKSKRNTYYFTKTLAEQLITMEATNIPSCIIRASLITSCLNEPIPGWIDNVNSITNIVINTGKGILRSYFGKPNLIADLIPADYVVNCMITSSWYRSNLNTKSFITNCTTGCIKPLTWREFSKSVTKYTLMHPFNDIYWYPTDALQKFALVNTFNNYVYHKFPAVLFDLGLILFGRRPRMYYYQKNLLKSVHEFQYFTTNKWKVENKNLLKLMNSLNDADSETFNFNVRTIEWPIYMDNYVKGVRKYILHEDENSIQDAKKNLQRLQFLNATIKIMLLVGSILFCSHTTAITYSRQLVNNFMDWYDKYNVQTPLNEYFNTMLEKPQ